MQAPQGVIDEILGAEVFVIDNVAEYFYRIEGEATYSFEDFPNLAPPFPSVWFEFRLPRWHIEKVIAMASARARREGMGEDAVAKLAGGGSYAAAALFQYVENEGAAPDIVRRGGGGEARWLLGLTLYLQASKGGRTYGVSRVHRGIREDGRPVGEHSFGENLVPRSGDDLWNELGDAHRVTAMLKQFGYPAFFALSLLHCRNVVVDTNPPPPKLARKRRRKGEQEPVTFKTLRIEPMTRVLREAGAEDKKTGLKMALHIARGHFKHFGEKWGTKKLFGRHEGTYFWHDTLRGSSREGAVVKDYEVKAAGEGK
jgi:hypothetical protein